MPTQTHTHWYGCPGKGLAIHISERISEGLPPLLTAADRAKLMEAAVRNLINLQYVV